MQENRYPFCQKQEIDRKRYGPLLMFAVFLLLYAALSAAVLLMAGAVCSLEKNGDLSEAAGFMIMSMHGTIFTKKYSTQWMIAMFGTNIAMMPSLELSHRAAFGKAPAKIISASGRWRWSVFARRLALSAAFFGSYMLLTARDMQKIWACIPAKSMLLLIAMCLLQCLAEEMVFRGYALQTFSALSGSALFGILIQAFCFTIAHLYTTEMPALVFITAFIWGILCCVTNGIEASFSMHLIFNLAHFVPDAAGYGMPADTGKAVYKYAACIAASVIIAVLEAAPKAMPRRQKGEEACLKSRY